MTTRPHDDNPLCRFGQGDNETRIPANLDHVRGSLWTFAAAVAVAITLGTVFVTAIKAVGWKPLGFVAGILAVAMTAGVMFIMAGGQSDDR